MPLDSTQETPALTTKHGKTSAVDGYSEADIGFMRRANRLARKGEGRVEPNPMVGCVIAKGDRIIGEGYHRRFGGPHAEIVALRSCRSNPRGASVFVTLEPCCHVGKTPPCVDALIDAGVRKVIIAVRDPNPAVSGRGLRRLRGAGITAPVGLLQDEAAAILAPFTTRMKLDRPYVIAKWAQSIDGKLATRTGHSQWISCEASRRCVHRLRARVDAVLVGSGTVLIDDPMLTARNVPLRRQATRIVLDGRLRTPLTAKLVATARTVPTLILTATAKARSSKARRMQRLGVEVLAVRSLKSGIDLRRVLTELATRHATNLLVEGGPMILTAFHTAGLIDEAHIYVAPMLIGGNTAPGPLVGRGPATIGNTTTPWLAQSSRCGIDTFHRLVLHDPASI